MKQAIPLLAAMFLILGYSPATAENDDMASLQGDWVAHKALEQGEDISDFFLQGSISLRFKDNTWAMEEDGETITGTFTLDTEATPKQIDMQLDEGQDELVGPDAPKGYGIYEFKDENLLLALAFEGPEQRATSLGDDAEAVVVTFKRITTNQEAPAPLEESEETEKSEEAAEQE